MTRNIPVTPMVYGHRGASAHARENTLEAFALAFDLGADGIECDLRRSTDDRIVIHHDPHYPDGRTVADTPSGERPAHVPLLDDVLTAVAGRGLVNLEIKNLPGEPGFDPAAGIVDLLADVLADRGWAPRHPVYGALSVSSFHPPTLQRVHDALADLTTGVLTFLAPSAHEGVRIAVDGGHGAIHPHVSQVDPDVVAAAHAVGLAVNVWTVNDPEVIARMAACAVDGVITDAPDVARSVIG